MIIGYGECFFIKKKKRQMKSPIFSSPPFPSLASQKIDTETSNLPHPWSSCLERLVYTRPEVKCKPRIFIFCVPTFAPLFTINVPLIAPLTSFKPEDRASSVFSVIYVITAKRPIGVCNRLVPVARKFSGALFSTDIRHLYEDWRPTVTRQQISKVKW